MGFSLEQGNLYQAENINEAKESYAEKRDRILDGIINNGKATQDFDEREKYRLKLEDKIREGFIDREYLSKFEWDADKILISKEIVNFLLPPIKAIEKKEVAQPIIKQIKETFLITRNGEGLEIGNGAGMEKKRLIPRFELLVNFLEKNGIAADKYLCYKGENRSMMMREETYIMFVIPDLDKMVFLCDEEGNASYIIHKAPTKSEFESLMRDEEIVESERQPRFYYRMSKDDLQGLKEELGIVSCVRWDEANWLEKMSDKLTKNVNNGTALEDIKKIIEKRRGGKIEEAPSGWMTIYAVASQLRVANKTIERIANRHIGDKTGWIKNFKSKKGRIVEYYSPELIEIIKKSLLAREEEAPFGWMTNSALASQFDADFYTVKHIADKHLGNKKEWAKKFRDKMGKIAWHYSPELIKIIKEKVKKTLPAPPGWMTNNALAVSLHVKFGVVKCIADKYADTNKDWFKNFKDRAGIVPRINYSPELVSIITKEISEQQKAPADWVTNRELARLLNVSRRSVEKIADRYVGVNKDWLKLYKKNGRDREHYSPGLIEIIKRELAKEKAGNL